MARYIGGRHKPGSVSARGIPTGSLQPGPAARWQPFICAACCQTAPAANPGLSARNTPAAASEDRAARDPYLALLRAGFAMRALLPTPRCALAAPFHPCLCEHHAVRAIGGLLSVALSLTYGREVRGGRALPAALVSWSPDFPRDPCGPRGCLGPPMRLLLYTDAHRKGSLTAPALDCRLRPRSRSAPDSSDQRVRP